jgi:hypothetical protein
MSPPRLRHPAFIAAVAVMAIAAVGMESAISRYQIYLRKKPIEAEPIIGPEGQPVARVLRNIPAETEHFIQVGTDYIESADNLEVLGTDNYLTRVYREKSSGDTGRHVQLHVAYYTGMIDTVPHVPERCLVGGGMELSGGPWLVTAPLNAQGWLASPDDDGSGRLFTTRLSNRYSTAIPGKRINLPRDLTPDKPLRLRISKFAGSRGAPLYAGYFFVANGGWVSSAEEVRFLAFDLKADYAYYLKVQVGSTEVSSETELAALAGVLLDDLFGEIMTCVPDWARVQKGLWPADNPKAAQTSGGRQP